MSTDFQQQDRGARRAAAKYAFWLASAACLSAGIYMTLADSQANLKESLSGLGLNLVASSIFAIVFASLSDRENRLLVQSEIASNFAQHSDSMAQLWSNGNRLHLPEMAFPATKGFDKVFNRSLMEAFEESSFYYFRGASAKYVPARIRASRRCPNLVRVFIPGPTATAAIRARVADRLKNPKYASMSPDALFSSFREEMIASFVGLYDCHSYCPIEIGFCADTSVTRIEMTDRTLFVSWYHAPNTSGQAFPQTYRFGQESLYFQVHLLDLTRRIDIADKVIRFGGSVTESEFRTTLASIFGRQFTAHDVAAYRHRYWESMKDFLRVLEE